jgi:hypothetical protein
MIGSSELEELRPMTRLQPSRVALHSSARRATVNTLQMLHDVSFIAQTF